MPAVAMDALAHGALESGIGPGADASLGIGCDIGAVDRAERGLDGSAAGIDGAAVRNRMADRAVAKGGKLLAAGDGCGRKHRGIRPGNRRDRPPWQHGGGDTECRGT